MYSCSHSQESCRTMWVDQLILSWLCFCTTHLQYTVREVAMLTLFLIGWYSTLFSYCFSETARNCKDFQKIGKLQGFQILAIYKKILAIYKKILAIYKKILAISCHPVLVEKKCRLVVPLCSFSKRAKGYH